MHYDQLGSMGRMAEVALIDACSICHGVSYCGVVPYLIDLRCMSNQRFVINGPTYKEKRNLIVQNDGVGLLR